MYAQDASKSKYTSQSKAQAEHREPGTQQQRASERVRKKRTEIVKINTKGEIVESTDMAPFTTPSTQPPHAFPPTSLPLMCPTLGALPTPTRRLRS